MPFAASTPANPASALLRELAVFDGSPTAFRLVFGHEDDTVNPEAEALRKFKLVLRGVGLCILYENIFHGSVIESGWAFRPGKHAAADQ